MAPNDDLKTDIITVTRHILSLQQQQKEATGDFTVTNIDLDSLECCRYLL